MSLTRVAFSLIPLASLVFAATFVGFEHFNGGVKTHHFGARRDLPGFSNWLSLLILPLLGMIVAHRANSKQAAHTSKILPPPLAVGAAASFAYGAALAGSFLFRFEQVSLILFVSLFLLSLVLPVYRAEWIFGFVTGMTIAFGSVIPLVFAIVFATISFVARRVTRYVLSAMGKPRPLRDGLSVELHAAPLSGSLFCKPTRSIRGNQEYPLEQFRNW
ncbi:MAG: hypothetical protein FJW36_24000 [Acidobacteria bacterium]|nr:hypothetical protein [Acidobacteriota bacterium]